MYRVLLFTWLASLVCCEAACVPRAEDSRRAENEPREGLSGEELFARGVRFARGGDSARAAEYLEAALRRGMPEQRVAPYLVAVLARAGRLSQARLRAAEYVRRHPSGWKMRVVLASLQQALGDPEEAIVQLRAACRLAPEEPLPHYHLGTLLAERGEPGARAALERYLELAPDAPHAEEARALLSRLTAPQEERPSTEPPVGPVEERPSTESLGGPVPLSENAR